jgi:hypothetical protein
MVTQRISKSGSRSIKPVSADKVDLRFLIEHFNLKYVQNLSFFSEWQGDLPIVTAEQKSDLDVIKQGYLNLLDYPPLLESAVQVAVLGPMMFLGRFFLPPFHVRGEKSIKIENEDHGVKVNGKLDILLLRENFWVMAIESKRSEFSLEAGRAQILSYMLANPDANRPSYGLVTSGGSFTFLKLTRGETNHYSLSRIFEVINPGNELYDVFAILKKIATL